MFLTNRTKAIFIALTLALASCSASKQGEQSVGSQSSSQKAKKDEGKLGAITDFSAISLMLNTNQIDAREAGKLVGEVLQANQTNDLRNFNYEANNKNYSDFSKALNIKFGEESDQSLIFLAEALGISTIAGYDKLDRVGKEKEILKRVGMIKEKSYLELEFFLAHYFLNNKIFESLKAISIDTENENLTYCKGYLLDFVKNTYKKNSRYPDAFKKYAIWGEVLSECDLGPIFVPGIAQIQASYPKEVKAEQLILVKILKSNELNTLQYSNMRFNDKTPAIVKTLINHILFSAKALNNSSQVVFDLNSINNALVFLDKISTRASDADENSQLNLPDHFWFDLHLNLRESLSDKAEFFNKLYASPEATKKLHPLLKAIGIEVTGQVNESELKEVLGQTVELKSSLFLEKWNLIKESITLRAYITALSKKSGSDLIIHSLKDKLEIILKRSAKLYVENSASSSVDPLYQDLKKQLGVNSYIEAGRAVDINELNLAEKSIVINPLSKIVTSQNNLSLDLSNVRSGYFDFTPKTENLILPASIPTKTESPRVEVIVTATTSQSKTEFQCLKEIVCDPERPVFCDHRRNFCELYRAYNYTVTTVAPSRPLQPQKVSRSKDGLNIAITMKSNPNNNIIVFLNGENGYKGTKGTNSPLCVGGIYNSFTSTKNGSLFVTQNAYNSGEAVKAQITSTKTDVEAGLSGEGGDGGNGGTIKYNGVKSSISLLALGGVGGAEGEAASCSTIADSSRPLNLNNASGILGRKGTSGKKGIINEVLSEN